MEAVAVPPVADRLASLTPAGRRSAMAKVTVAWMFGAVWMNALAGAPLTVFATKLGATNFEFGLLAAMPFLAALLSLPSSLLADRSGQRKRLFFIGQYVNRLLWIAVALVPPWALRHYGSNGGGHGPAAAVFVFLSLVFVINTGQALASPAWVSWMADLVPTPIRGRYFARRRQWGIVTAVPASLLAGWLLDRYRGADDAAVLGVCGAIFIVAALFGVADGAMFHFVPHAVRPKPSQPLLRSLGHPLRNGRFVWFSLGVGILWFAVAGQAQFVNKYVVDRLQLRSTTVQTMMLVGPLLAQLLVLPVWGRTIDRFGKKPALLIATLGLVPVGAGWVLLGREHVWLGYVLAAAGAVLWTGVDVANFNLTLELSGTDANGRGGGSAYMAMNAVIVNVAGCLGGLFFGLLAERLSDFHRVIVGPHAWTYFEVMFAVSAVLRLVAVGPMLKVREPEAEPTLDALRFMAGSLYNNAIGAVTLPARLFVRKPSDSEPL